MPFQVQDWVARWSPNPARLASYLLSSIVAISALAADPREYAVEVSVTVQNSPLALQLAWPSSSIARQYIIRRRTLGAGDWGAPKATLPGTAAGYTDTTVSDGAPYEYEVQMETTVPATGGGWMSAYGYVYAGANVPPPDFKGKAVLLIDSSVAPALGTELATFERDLIGAGWSVVRREVSRTASPVEVKNVVRTESAADPFNVRAVVLIGHVPVPYSGNIAPDLHESHRGAWPGDVYYGELDGSWTDDTVNVGSFDSEDNDNRPGDGKFDQSQIPSAVELEVGRIDFSNLPTFAPRTEVDLLRTYFRKNHEFRHRNFTADRRGLIRDNFGDLDGDAPAVDAWRHFPQFFGPGNIQEVGAGQFFPVLNAESYLWAYGCGGGGYIKADGVGSTSDFALNDPKAVFLVLHGSYFGDWNNSDNFLRAAIATPNFTLASIWSGLPHWFMHPMGLGTTIGYCTRLSQNNISDYKSHQNFSANQVHISLIGDPTLEMFPVIPPSNLGGTAGGSVVLNWNGSPEENLAGYHVYYSTSPGGPYQRLTTAPVTGTSYSHNIGEGTYHYMVRSLKLERTGSGSFYNLSQGIFTTVTQGSGGGTIPSVSITTSDSDSGESGGNRGEFRITRSVAGDSPLTVEYLVGGTAQNGLDYSSIPTSVTIQPGSNETLLAVLPIADTVSEGDETVTIQLRPTPAYTVGSPSAGFLRIHDAAVNQPPVISALTEQSISVNSSVTVSFQISDPESSPDILNVRALSSNLELVPVTGLILAGTGSDRTLQIIAAPNRAGQATITVLVSDGEIESSREFQLTVVEPNLTPTAHIQNATTFKGRSVPVTLTGSDPEGALLTFSIESNPALGTLTGTPPNLTYHPGGDSVGTDSFAFTVSDGVLESEPAIVSITILATNRPPSATPQSVFTSEDNPSAITVAGVDPDGDLLQFEILTGPTHGALTGRDANYLYRPATNYFGSDSFTFRVSDGTATSPPATVSIEVASVNDVPVVASGTIQLREDHPVPVTLSGTDVEGEPLVFEIINLPAKGQLSGTSPTLTFTPSTNATGSDSFTFRARDAAGGASGVGTISLVIIATNDPPVALNQSLSTAEDSPVTVPISGADPDGDPLVFRVVGEPQRGTLTGLPPNLLYTPRPGANGADLFSFVLNDGKVDSAPATISIEVQPRNDPPTISSIPMQFARKNAAVGPLPVFVHDPDNNAAELVLSAASSHPNLLVPGGVNFSGEGTNRTVTILPERDADGTTIVTITVSDGEAQAEISFLLTVTNTVPTAMPDTISGLRGRMVIPFTTLTSNDHDPDGDRLDIVSVSQSQLGRNLLFTSEGLVYTAEPGQSDDSFEYTVQDSSAATAKARVTIVMAERPRIQDVEMTQGGIVLQVSGIPNARFRVQRSFDARTWSLAGEGMTDAAGRATFTDPGGSFQHHEFYRLEWP